MMKLTRPHRSGLQLVMTLTDVCTGLGLSKCCLWANCPDIAHPDFAAYNIYIYNYNIYIHLHTRSYKNVIHVYVIRLPAPGLHHPSHRRRWFAAQAGLPWMVFWDWVVMAGKYPNEMFLKKIGKSWESIEKTSQIYQIWRFSSLGKSSN